MSRKDFLDSIKVEQSVIDKCTEISRAAGQKIENGQYTTGQREQERAHVTGFDREGDFINEDRSVQESLEKGSDFMTEQNHLSGVEVAGNHADHEIAGGIDSGVNEMDSQIENGIDAEVNGGIEDGIDNGVDGGMDNEMDGGIDGSI